MCSLTHSKIQKPKIKSLIFDKNRLFDRKNRTSAKNLTIFGRLFELAAIKLFLRNKQLF